jgi:hypothetical protein
LEKVDTQLNLKQSGCPQTQDQPHLMTIERWPIVTNNKEAKNGEENGCLAFVNQLD